MDNTAENIDPKKIYDRARELIAYMESREKCNGLLLTYDPDEEKFQFLAMHADLDEVLALLLSGMGVVRETVKDTDGGRTLN
jgi:hypothetical protein